MAKSVKVQYDAEDMRAFLKANKPIRDLLMSQGQAVATEAQDTASAAEGGPGGRIDGYAAAGFSVSWHQQGRPQVRIASNADPSVITAVHFHTQKKNGVAHLRAALYKFTQRG